MYDFVIIGGGFGGLSAGALLAKKGKKVLVLEKGEHPGGRAMYFEEDGFVWQYGQHSHRLGPEGHANEVAQRLGKELSFIKVPKGKSKIFYKDRLYDRPEGPIGFLTTGALPFKTRLSFIKLYIKLLRADSSLWYDRTLYDFYAEHSKIDPDLEDFLNFLGFTIMLPDINLVSAGEVIDFLRRVKKASIPVADVRGGSKQIIDMLTGFIKEKNGEVRTLAPVTEILVSEGRARGVIVSGEKITGENIVYAAPIQNFFSLTDKSLFNKTLVDYSLSIQSSSGVVIDWVSKEPLSDLTGGILGVDEPLWVKFQTLFDDSVAPEGHHVCSWGLLNDFGETISSSVVERTEKRLREIASICMPGFEEKVVKERKMVIPVLNANMLVPQQSKPHRVPVKSSDVENLFFVGDTTQGDGCSGDIAFSSALKLDDMVV